MVNPIAEQIKDALLQIFGKEMHIIAGRHIQRDQVAGVFRFLPGKTRQTLLSDIGLFSEQFVDCCRGVGFTVQVTETQSKGVGVDIKTIVSPELGRNLVDR